MFKSFHVNVELQLVIMGARSNSPRNSILQKELLQKNTNVHTKNPLVKEKNQGRKSRIENYHS